MEPAIDPWGPVDSGQHRPSPRRPAGRRTRTGRCGCPARAFSGMRSLVASDYTPPPPPVACSRVLPILVVSVAGREDDGQVTISDNDPGGGQDRTYEYTLHTTGGNFD